MSDFNGCVILIQQFLGSANITTLRVSYFPNGTSEIVEVWDLYGKNHVSVSNGGVAAIFLSGELYATFGSSTGSSTFEVRKVEFSFVNIRINVT